MSELREILKPMFEYEVSICKICGHLEEEHYWNGSGIAAQSGIDSCLVEGCKCSYPKDGFRTETRMNTIPECYIDELSTLISHERAEAVKSFLEWRFNKDNPSGFYNYDKVKMLDDEVVEEYLKEEGTK